MTRPRTVAVTGGAGYIGALVVEELLRAAQCFGVVARIVERAGRGLVGEVARRDEVGEPQLYRIDLQSPCQDVYEPLQRERRFGPARAPVRGARTGVG